MEHKGMVWNFISPAPHPKYVHPTGIVINYFHLQENGHFGQIFFETTYVSNGCIYLPHIFEDGIQVPKVCFDAIFGQIFFENFRNFYPRILRENGPMGNFRGFARFWA